MDTTRLGVPAPVSEGADAVEEINLNLLGLTIFPEEAPQTSENLMALDALAVSERIRSTWDLAENAQAEVDKRALGCSRKSDTLSWDLMACCALLRYAEIRTV
jgi:hypothetical protein